MTKEQKIAWLEQASTEELLKQYETLSFQARSVAFGFLEYGDDLELTKAEVIRRMTK